MFTQQQRAFSAITFTDLAGALGYGSFRHVNATSMYPSSHGEEIPDARTRPGRVRTLSGLLMRAPSAARKMSVCICAAVYAVEKIETALAAEGLTDVAYIKKRISKMQNLLPKVRGSTYATYVVHK